MRHIPNILSGLRILMVGMFVYFFLQGRYVSALIIYVLAVLTDSLDGYLARHNNWISDLGKILDPLADKLMLIAALTCFCVRGWIPIWLGAIVVSKEVLLIIGSAFLYKREIVVYSDWSGKAATSFFNIGIITTMCKGFWPWIGKWNILLLTVAAILALVALVHYTVKHVYNNKDEIMKNNKRETSPE